MIPIHYSDDFRLPLPPNHRFPKRKYTLLREKLIAEGIVAPGQMVRAENAARRDVLRAHDVRTSLIGLKYNALDDLLTNKTNAVQEKAIKKDARTDSALQSLSSRPYMYRLDY